MPRKHELSPGDGKVELDPTNVEHRDQSQPETRRVQETHRTDTDDVSDMSSMESANAVPTAGNPVSDMADAGGNAGGGSSSMSKLQGALRRSAHRGADEAADVAAGALHAGVRGLRNLPQTAVRVMGRAFGPVGAVFTRAGHGVADALNVSYGVGNGVVAAFLALALGSGAFLAGSAGGFNPALLSAYDPCIWEVAAEASSQYGAAENKIPESLNGHPLGDVYTVCVNLDTYGYPAASVQHQWQEEWKDAGRKMTNELPTINGRYLVATTNKYGAMGDAIDFYLDDGTIIPCIRAEAKSEKETDYDHNPANEWGHQDGRCIIEFQWCTGSGYDKYGTNPGKNYFEELGGHRVAGWTNRGPAAGSDGSIIGGAGGASNAAGAADAANGMDECGQRQSFADNSSAAAAMASISYSKHVTLGEGYRCSALYKKVHDEVTSYPGSYYCSCDFAVGTAVRWSGTDIEFPTNPASEIHRYLVNSPKWEKVSDDAMNFDDIQPGDVCSTDGHVAMYIGEEIVSQVYESTLKGTDADLGKPDANQVWAQASNQNRGNDSHPLSRPPCLDTGVSPNMEVYRCVKPDGSDKYNDIAIAGVTSLNSASVPACECEVVAPKPADDQKDEDAADEGGDQSGDGDGNTGGEGEQEGTDEGAGDDNVDGNVTASILFGDDGLSFIDLLKGRIGEILHTSGS